MASHQGVHANYLNPHFHKNPSDFKCMMLSGDGDLWHYEMTKIKQTCPPFLPNILQLATGKRCGTRNVTQWDNGAGNTGTDKSERGSFVLP